MSGGLRWIVSSLKNRIISHDLQDLYLFRQELFEDAGSFEPASNRAGGDLRQISYRIYDSEKALDYVESINPMTERMRRFAIHRLASGDMVVIAFFGDEPVFHGWLMFGEIEMTYGVFMPTSEGIAFGYNLFTKTSYRRCGALSGFYRFVHEYLKERGFHTLYIGISTRNRPSIIAHMKNGFEKTGYFYTLNLSGLSFTLARFEYAKRFYINGS